jgi:hypothetical protein
MVFHYAPTKIAKNVASNSDGDAQKLDHSYIVHHSVKCYRNSRTQFGNSVTN